MTSLYTCFLKNKECVKDIYSTSSEMLYSSLFVLTLAPGPIGCKGISNMCGGSDIGVGSITQELNLMPDTGLCQKIDVISLLCKTIIA